MKKRRIVIISLAGLIALAVAGWAGYGWWLKHRLERYQARLAASGERMTLAEVLGQRSPPVHNGAILVRQAQARLQRGGVLSTNPPAAMRLVAPARALTGWRQSGLVDYAGKVTNSWEELAVELRESREGLELLHQLVDQPAMDFGLDYSQGFTLLLPHLAPLKSAAQTLSAATLLELHQGNPAAAALHLRAMVALSRGIEDEPLLISQLVRLALAQIAVNATWELLQSPGLDDTMLRQLQADWSAVAFLKPMRHALEMERVINGVTIQHYRQHGGVYDLFRMGAAAAPAPASTSEKVIETSKRFFSPKEIRKNSSELLWQSALSYEDEIKALMGLQILIETCRDIETNRCFQPALSNAVFQLEAMGQFAASDSDFDWMGNDDPSLADIRNLFGASSPTLLKSLKKVESVESVRWLVVTAIALKRCELRHGEIPAELAALVPEFLSSVPADPVDGRPLRYRRNRDRTILLYSIGADGVDNGGDGGRPEADAASRLNLILGRDWVWPQPGSPGEIQAWQTRQNGRPRRDDAVSEEILLR